MPQKLRWGILATGGITHKFAKGLTDAEGAELVAVGSRTQERADQFAREFDVPHAHGSYADLAADPDVEAIYVASPHPMHKDDSILCLRQGKAVLCEKPLTVNAAQAREMIDVARQEGVFLMEAMWSRFLPSIDKARELITDGAIGEPRMLQADFGYRTDWNPQSRNLNPELGGGGLLDVGIYPISLASLLLGWPREATGLAHIGETGVDEQAGMILSHDEGRIAVLATGTRTRTPHEADILGTEGRIRLHAPWWMGNDLTLIRYEGETQVIEVPKVGNGYNYEAEEVARCLAAGKTESETMPLDESLHLMEIMDRLRAPWGLKYPCE